MERLRGKRADVGGGQPLPKVGAFRGRRGTTGTEPPGVRAEYGIGSREAPNSRVAAGADPEELVVPMGGGAEYALRQASAWHLFPLETV